jgi:hypothetical protein
LVEEIAEIGLRVRIVRFSSLLEPVKSLGIILADALSVEEQNSQVVVSAGRALIGGRLEPVQRRGIVYGSAPTPVAGRLPPSYGL